MILLTEDNARPSRDEWPRKGGRVLVKHPDTGETIECYSPSSLDNYLGGGFSNPPWAARHQAKGAGLRPDLAIMAAPLDPKADRDELDRIVAQLELAGGRMGAANRGTAMHSAIRRILRGLEPDMPEGCEADIEAIRTVIDEWGIRLVDDWDERQVIDFDLPACGSPDGYVTARDLDGEITFDNKTGQFKPLSCAVQLSCYANATHEATLVDGAVVAVPMPFTPRTDVALVLHAPWGDGKAAIIAVDIAEGYEMARLAVSVHQRTLDSGRFRIKDVSALAVAPVEPDTSGVVAEEPPVPTEAAHATAPHSLHARVGLLRRRAKILVEQGLLTGDEATKMLADTGVPPLTKPDDQTAETLDVWEGFLATIEMGLSTYGRTDAYVARLMRLPVDLYAHAEMRAKELDPPVPNLTTGKVTGPDLDRLEAVLAPIELMHAERVATVTHHLSELDSLDEERSILEWATEDRDEPFLHVKDAIDQLDNLEAERVIALCATYKVDDLEAAIRNIGTAAQAKAIAKQVTERHQIPMPTSARAIASDRVLAGLVLNAAQQHNA